ncbi:ABC transporter ATP-binding protein [Staphylococcus sp. HMSC056G08]|uniref:ABC transporter ATP-binding protein n=1 Tax=Staphylococcus sp. HMSC056G08 TaxID=1739350 RepID=UPI0008A1F2BA|nr:ATP-binding cassette domain-containing protein [Staphylococcus sp. HMSC056G08]OFJ76267.1 peptide ABC transporter ATP-binding protein [Staphylococcus sp. HMSC056G08]
MIKIKHLSFAYDKADILHNINLNIQKGELVGIIGESGSGKTTLMNLILGELTPVQGTIDINSTRILPIFQQATQSFNPKLTIKASLIEPLKYYANAEHSFDQVVSPLMSQLDLDSQLLTRYPDQVSGGQLQRFNVLRTVMLQPDVLICDEITSSLDVVAEQKLVEKLKAIHNQQQTTMIIISHDIAMLNQIVERMIVIQNGQIVDDFRTEQLFDESRHPYTKELTAAYNEN